MRLSGILSFSLLSMSGMLATACGGDDATDSVPTQAEIAEILGAGQPGTCSISSCHGSAIASAGLDFMADSDLGKLLVGHKSCEAPELNLVEPGDPEHSWLYLKLTAPTQGTKRDLVEDPEWGDAGKGCEEAAGFGKRMPETGAELSADKVEKIRKWIAAGAM